jgi:two-component system cell cycle sensor histidine kinase/response regulator CckA
MMRTADRRLERLLASVPGVVWEADVRARRLVYASEGTRELVGCPPELLLEDQARAVELVHPDDRAAILEASARAAAGEPERVRFRVVSDAGGVRWLESSIRRTADGMLGGLAHEVSDAIRAELHLSVQRALTQAIAGAASLEDAARSVVRALCRAFDWEVGGLWLETEPGGPLQLVGGYSSPLVDATAFLAESAALRLAAGEGFPGRVFATGIPVWVDSLPDYEPFRRPATAAAAGLTAALAFPVTRADRPIGILEFFVRESRRPDELLTAMMSAFGSQVGQLVERIRAERSRRESDARSRAYLEAALDAVAMIGPDGTVIEWNPAAERMFGYRRADVLGRELAELIVPPSLRTSHREAVARYAETGEARLIGQRLELTAMRADGTEFPVELTLSRGEGEAFLVCGAIRDISDRRRAEDELRRRESDYRLMFDSNPNPMWVYDFETLRFLAVNSAACSRYGYTADEFLSLTLLDIRPPEEVPRVQQAVADARRGGGYLGPRRFLHRAKSGEQFEVEITSHATLFNGREASVVFVVDVSERARLEEQLARAQKMEAVGRLAGGITHDFRNILAVVSGYADRVAHVRDEAALLDAAHELKGAAQRANELTRQLLAFASGQPRSATAVDPSEVVRDLGTLLRRVLTERVELVLRLPPRSAAVIADRSQLEQVLMNLAANARDAIRGDGIVRIEVTPVEVGRDASSAALELDPGPYVVLSVSDTGAGMDRETRERIFDPFFTTKSEREGTGLGLATVYGIVRQAGGNIWVYSEPGKGSVFKVYLPEAVGQPEVVEPSPPSEPAQRAPAVSATPATVLLVEDDPGLRKLEHLLLGERGYDVVAASTAAEALDLIAAADSIDLLLTDIVLPGMSGPELAELAVRRFPEIAVLFTSGYTTNTALRDRLRSRAAFIEKPFDPDQLVAKVAELLVPAGG